jgi:predicted house-cleaning noncanonical NTP pyrophosphatase (MazG superfamily)
MNATNKKFFNLFWTEPTCQAIFSVHKGQLLEDEVELILSKEKFYAQRIVLTNAQKRKAGRQIAKRSENESIELVHNLQNAVKEYFDEDKIEIFFKGKFGKTIKKIETDLSKSAGWFKIASKFFGSIDDENNLFKLLSDYHLIPPEIKTKEEFALYVEAELKKQIKEFLKKQNLSDLAISIDLLSGGFK